MKKLLLTLTLLLTLGFAASAAEAELTISNGAFVGSDDITVTIAKANGGTTPNWNTAGLVRVYAKNTINIKGATGITISKVVFTTASSNGAFLSGTVADNGTFTVNTKTWEGSAQEITITNGPNLSGGHTRVTGMTVTYSKETLTECPAPTFSVEDGDEVFRGQTITVNKKDATSVQLYVNDVEVDGESYTVPADADFGSVITLKAVSTLEGEGVTVPTNTTIITVTVAEKKVYSLLTDVADLYDGAKGYIVCTSSNVIMGAQNSGNYREKINLNDNAISAGVLSDIPEGAEMITFVKDGDNYNLKVSGGYLCLTEDGNKLSTKADAAKATISISGSDAKISFTNYTARSIRYNASSPRFACYAGSQQAVQIYIEPGVTPEPSLVEGSTDINITHGKVAGVLTIAYSFEIANYSGNEVVVTATINGKDHITFTKVDTPAAAPAREATENGNWMERGTLTAKHEDLKGEQTLNINVKATLDGKELYNEDHTPRNTTGIEDVTVEGNEAAEYFNLQGIRVAEPQAGQVYIVRRGAKTTKELVK